MDNSYRVQEDIKCCLTCDFCMDYGVDENDYECMFSKLSVDELGICDKWEKEE
jgi:hypothetical protein